jgi:hypothetical protein
LKGETNAVGSDVEAKENPPTKEGGFSFGITKAMAGTKSRRLAQNRFVSPMKRAPYFCAAFFAPIVNPFRILAEKRAEKRWR